MRRIAVINQKGGVGKTTTCCNVGAALAAAGRRVLMIDLDPQAHLTMHLGVEPAAERPSVYDVLTDGMALADATIALGANLDLVPSHIDLAAAEMELVSVMGREVILRDAVRALPTPYDILLIDCPPSLGVLTVNGLVAMNEVLVPMQPHFLALQGVGKLLETIQLVKDRINPDLLVTGVILCMYDAGTRLAGEVSSDLAAFLEAARDTDVPWSGASVFKTIIRRNIKLAECPSHGLTIAEYAPSSNGAADYASLAAELLGIAEVPIRPVIDREEESSGDISTEAEVGAETEVSVEADPASAMHGQAPVEQPAEPISAEGRVAYGPDDVQVGDSSEPVEGSSDEADDRDRFAPQPEPLPAPSSTMRMSIPIEYEDDLASDTPSGVQHG